MRRKLRRTDLRTLRLLKQHQGKEVPTVGGLPLFGHTAERQELFPDVWIQAGRFAGTDRRQILDAVEIRSLPVPAVGEAIAFVEKYLARAVVIGAARCTKQWSLPLVALREAIINAVVHADYAQRGAPLRLALFDDRLEIENPGLLPFGLRSKICGRTSHGFAGLVFGRVFQELGLIKQWSSGIQRMEASCRAAGLPMPKLEEIGTRLTRCMRCHSSNQSWMRKRKKTWRC